jgi:hypothetical protein
MLPLLWPDPLASRFAFLDQLPDPLHKGSDHRDGDDEDLSDVEICGH